MNDIKFTPLQKDILEFFGKNLFAKNFYWTGGTLLSYQYLHHRFSSDLDFFSDDLFRDDEYLIFSQQLKKTNRCSKSNFTIQHNRRLYLIERGLETVKLELVFFPFPSVGKRKKLPEFSLEIDSLTDIMVNKTLSTYQRNEPKDVFDLYCYLNCKPKYNLPKLIALVEKKFGVAIEPFLLLAKINELTNLLDSLSPLLLTSEKNLTPKIKSFFQEIFNSIVKKQIR